MDLHLAFVKQGVETVKNWATETKEFGKEYPMVSHSGTSRMDIKMVMRLEVARTE